MSPEEKGSDIDVKPELLSSGDGFLTYTRRKRSRSDQPGSPRRPVSILAIKEVSQMASGEGKNKDIGWEHGDMLPGNRFSWKCKWCGLFRCSGGVTRLKKHLAGAKHVIPCRSAPPHVARAMNDNLVEMHKRHLKRQRKKDSHVNGTTPDCLALDTYVKIQNGGMELDMQVSNATQQSLTTTRSLKSANQQSRDFNQQPFVAAQRSKFSMSKDGGGSQQSDGAVKRSWSSSSKIGSRLFNVDMVKSMDGTHDTMLCTNTCEEGGPAIIDGHWKNILEDMLHLPNLAEAGGILTCINDALILGPSDSSRNFRKCDSTNDSTNKDTAAPKDILKSNPQEQIQVLRPDISAITLLDVTKPDTNDRNLIVTNTVKCQELLRDMLRSEKFVFLCELLGKNFIDINVEKLFDLSQINTKMKNGVYGQSPGLFNQDVQQVWRRLQKIGEEIVLLASSLSNLSRDFLQRDVGADMVHEDLAHEAGQHQCEENHHVGAEQKNSDDIPTPIPSHESNPSTEPAQTEPSGLYKVSICKQCGTEANGEGSLIFEECAAVHHFSCPDSEPTVQEIPSRSWYCASCTKDKRLSPKPPLTESELNNLHHNCVVCDNRLEFSEAKDAVEKGRENSVSSMESDEPPEPSRTALSRLCKQCGTCEDDDKRFLICGHSQCPYKYYHIRCLRTSQIASLQQRNKDCWYCPSCLCRSCFVDKDDDKIVLCDDCDEAYHTYCMKPPRSSVPVGQWYCIQCNVARAKEGMRRYEEWILQMHGKKEARQDSEGSRPMDVLLSAVEKLSSEEHLVATRKD